MDKKKLIEALDFVLKDLMEQNKIFGGKVVIFDGDFRQLFLLFAVIKKKILSIKAYHI